MFCRAVKRLFAFLLSNWIGFHMFLLFSLLVVPQMLVVILQEWKFCCTWFRFVPSLLAEVSHDETN